MRRSPAQQFGWSSCRGKEAGRAARAVAMAGRRVSTSEEAMHASIRRYTPTTATRKDMDDLKHRIEDGFLPMVQEIRGFHSYGAVNVGNKEIVTISIFEDKDGATESTRRA